MIPGPMYLCVYLAEFPAQAMLRLRTPLAQNAVAVLEGEAPLERVCSINQAARRVGVQRGMTRVELESFSGITVLRRSVEEERAAQGALLETTAFFTPRVEVHSLTPDCAVILDIAGTERLFGPPETIARRLLTSLGAIGLHARAAIARNMKAALCVARPSATEVHPRRITTVAEGGEAVALAGLPLDALQPSPEEAETLALWGLRTAGELAALPEVEVVVRLGQAGRQLWLRARGQAEHLMLPVEAPFCLEEVMEFDAPVEDMEALLFVLGPMLQQLIARAGNRALQLASVTVRLSLEGGGEHLRTTRPALPVADQALLLKLIHLDLVAHPPAVGVLRLAVTADPGARRDVQLGLWTPQMPEPMRLEVTLARISALVGEGRVGRPVLGDSHRSDSVTVERFTVPSATPHPQEHELACGMVGLRRMRPPVPVRMRTEGGGLQAFHMQGVLYKVRQSFGPWRRSGAWWSGEVWSQEEWEMAVEANEGEPLLCVLSHDLLRDRWHMDAMYD